MIWCCWTVYRMLIGSRCLAVTHLTINPGVVSSIPHLSSVSDETLNRGPMYQCFTRACKRTRWLCRKKSMVLHQGSSVSVSLSGTSNQPTLCRHGRKQTIKKQKNNLYIVECNVNWLLQTANCMLFRFWSQLVLFFLSQQALYSPTMYSWVQVQTWTQVIQLSPHHIFKSNRVKDSNSF